MVRKSDVKGAPASAPAASAPVSSALPARLAALRRREGQSQAALAQALGVSRSAIAQWETGRAAPHHAHLLKLAAHYRVSLEYLLFGEDKYAALAAQTADEAALLRLFRELAPEDRAALLREALARARSTQPGKSEEGKNEEQKGGAREGEGRKGGEQKEGEQKGGQQKGGEQKGGERKGGERKGKEREGADPAAPHAAPPQAAGASGKGTGRAKRRPPRSRRADAPDEPERKAAPLFRDRRGGSLALEANPHQIYAKES
jgi:transcriptional regulator with XRE-family HTH domain